MTKEGIPCVGASQLSGPNIRISCATAAGYSDDPVDGEETMRCGWINADGEKWGAIWRFDKDTAGFNEYNGAMRYFEVPDSEEDPGDARWYHFTNLSSYANTSFAAGDIVDASHVGSVYRYAVPNVDENPVFLRFGQ